MFREIGEEMGRDCMVRRIGTIWAAYLDVKRSRQYPIHPFTELHIDVHRGILPSFCIICLYNSGIP